MSRAVDATGEILQRLAAGDLTGRVTAEFDPGTVAFLLRNCLGAAELASRLHHSIVNGHYLGCQHGLNAVPRLDCRDLRQHLVNATLIGLLILLCQVDDVPQQGGQLQHAGEAQRLHS